MRMQKKKALRTALKQFRSSLSTGPKHYQQAYSIDYAQTRHDVEPFIHDSAVMDTRCPDFFKQITEKLKILLQQEVIPALISPPM